MHEHAEPQTCKHELKHCKKCDVVYCEKCKKEWSTSMTFTNPWPTTGTLYPYYTIGDGNVSFTHGNH
jgi:hypothetical protein